MISDLTFSNRDHISNLSRLEFEQLKLTRKNLFTNLEISEVSSIEGFSQIPKVEQGKSLVISTVQCSNICACVVDSWMALMARGHLLNNECYIALSHILDEEPEEMLSTIQQKLISSGCCAESIKFYLVGGRLFDGNIGGLDSFKLQQKYLSYADQYHIVSCLLNITENDEALIIVLSKEALRWQKILKKLL